MAYISGYFRSLVARGKAGAPRDQDQVKLHHVSPVLDRLLYRANVIRHNGALLNGVLLGFSEQVGE